MTIGVNDRLTAPMAGDGTTQAFGFDFPVSGDSEVKVLVRDAAGALSTKLLLLDYTVTINADGTGAVYLLTPPVADETVTIVGATRRSQDADLALNAVLPSDAVEAALDDAVKVVQEQGAVVDRALAGPLDESALGSLPRAAMRANKYLYFDADGEPQVAEGTNSELPEVAARLDAAEASLATATQDISLNTDALAAHVARLDQTALDLIGVDTAVAGHDTQITTLLSTVDALTAVDTSGFATLLSDETAAREAADTALVDTLALIGAVSIDGLAFDINASTVTVSTGETLASRLDGLRASIDGNTADLVTETTARATETAALSSSVDAVVARVGLAEADIATNAAAVAVNAQAIVDGNSSLSQRIDEVVAASSSTTTYAQGTTPSTPSDGDLWFNTSADNALYRWDGVSWVAVTDPRIATNAAAIAGETTARTTAVDAVASDVTTLTSRVATAEGDIAAASIQITAATSAAAAAQSTADALFGVTVDVNGHVSGFASTNDGVTSHFSVVATNFQIVDPTTNLPQQVFSIDGGIVTIPNLRVGSADISDLSVDKLTAGSVNVPVTQNGDLTMGTGRIIFNTGAWMKVMGINFGVDGNLLEWFGPSMDVSLCSKANAVQYLDNAGGAYFGGQLSAGTITNRGQTTNTLVPSEVVVGPAASNGGTISVVHAYTYQRTGTRSGASSVSGSTSATLELYQQVGTAAETLVASRTVTGQLSSTYDFETNRTTFTETMSGTWTYSDIAAIASDRAYRWALTDRSTQAVSGTSAGADAVAQTLSVVATE